MDLSENLGQVIKISRGEIEKRVEAKPFSSGELFYDYETQDLYIGGTRANPENAISIGGLNTLRWQGDWNHPYLPDQNTQVYPGYLYRCTVEIPESEDFEQVLVNDLILYVEDKTKTVLDGEGYWIKLNQAGGGGDSGDLSEEIENRETIDISLQDQIDSITEDLSAEVIDRIDTDNTLQTNIDNKANKNLDNIEGVLPETSGGTGQTNLAAVIVGTATVATHIPTTQPDSTNGAIWVV